MAGDEASDAELVERVRKGDQSAWDILVRRHSNRLWAVARAHRLSVADGQDVVQVAFLQLLSHIHTLREPARVGSWLATTARNECLRLLRRAGRAVPSGDDAVLDAPDPLLPPLDANLLADERLAALAEAMARIPAPCQRLLRVLMADPEPTYEEVSAALGMPVGSIGPTRGRCLKQLRRLLGGT